MSAPFVITDGGREKEGFGHETRDCVVRAIATAYCLPYAIVHAELEQLGRKARRRISTYEAMQGRVFLWTEENVHRTVAGFVKDYPRGHYVIKVRGHAVALVDGILYDKVVSNTLRCRVVQVWKVL
jgi:hypothetical protein